jgi:hypothetical protein
MKDADFLALISGMQLIVDELRELRRAVLADRVLVPDSIGEMTRSKAVLSNDEREGNDN